MDKLAEVLAKLDPQNANHWSPDGSPRLETVRMLAGNPKLTREQIEAARPGFNRSVAAGEPAAAALTPPPLPVPSNDTQTQPASDDPGPGAVGPAPAQAEVEQGEVAVSNAAGEAEIEALEQAIDKENEAIARMTVQRDELTKEIAAANLRRDDAVEKRDRLRPPETLADGIRMYLDRQKMNLMERARIRGQIVASGVKLGELAKLTSPSPIDQKLRGRKRQVLRSV